MEADPKCGDVVIELAADTGERCKFVLRPSFVAIIEIEEQTGQSIFALARRFSKAEIGQHDAAHIITAGLNAAGETVSYVTVGDMIARSGLSDVLVAVGDFLGKVLAGYENTDDAGTASRSEAERVA